MPCSDSRLELDLPGLLLGTADLQPPTTFDAGCERVVDITRDVGRLGESQSVTGAAGRAKDNRTAYGSMARLGVSRVVVNQCSDEQPGRRNEFVTTPPARRGGGRWSSRLEKRPPQNQSMPATDTTMLIPVPDQSAGTECTVNARGSVLMTVRCNRCQHRSTHISWFAPSPAGRSAFCPRTNTERVGTGCGHRRGSSATELGEGCDPRAVSRVRQLPVEHAAAIEGAAL